MSTVSNVVNTLDDRMWDELGEGSFSVRGGHGLFMEVIDTATGLVWMTADTVQMEDYETLELEDGLRKVGIAAAPMDQAAFQYSPGAPESPVLERMIGGRQYINVAKPEQQTPPALPGGPLEISVNKAHVIGFEAGRSVAVLSLPEGDFVELVGDNSGDDALVLPEGGIIKQVQLEQPWVVSLPTPTRTFFWFGEGMRSFQGPVTLP